MARVAKRQRARHMVFAMSAGSPIIDETQLVGIVYESPHHIRRRPCYSNSRLISDIGLNSFIGWSGNGRKFSRS